MTEATVTTTYEADAWVFLGRDQLLLKATRVNYGRPYLTLGTPSTRLEIREADWPAFKEAVESLFEALNTKEREA